MHVKILLKKDNVEKVWPAKLTLFIYVSIHYDETVKQLDCNMFKTHNLS